MSDYFKENGILNLSQDSIKYQVSTLGGSYKDARALFRTTGEGLTEDDIQKKIVTLKGKFYSITANQSSNRHV